MYLNCALPTNITDDLIQKIGREEPVQYAVRGDLTPNRGFGVTYVIVTETHVAVADGESVTTLLPLKSIREVRIDEMFGSCCLTAKLDDGEKRLAYYTKAHVPEFGVFCRVLDNMVKDRTIEIPDHEGEVTCPRCGSPLPERGASCPKCVPRWHVFVRLIGLLKPHRGKLALVVATTFIGVGAQMTPPYITKLIMDDVIEARDLSPLLPLIAVMLAAFTLQLIVQWWGGYLSAWLAATLIASLRTRLHAHLQRLKMSYLGKREAGEMVSRVMHDTRELQGFLIDGLPRVLVNVVQFAMIAVILVALDLWLALLVFLPVPFLVGGVKWFWRKLSPLFHRHGSRRGKLHSILGESISGIKAIKATTREEFRAGQFDNTNQSLRQTVTSIERNWLGFMISTRYIMNIGLTMVWLVASWRIVGGSSNLTKGTLIAFLGYGMLFYMPMQWFTVVLNWMSHAFAGAERIFAILDTQPEIYDAPGAVAVERIAGKIEFDDVHFSYERGKEVIRGIDFSVKPGEMIGLVGKSGAGKSTIINLICRFYDVDSGMVRIDDYPIKKLKLESLRKQIGIVMQEPFLFRASLLENIRYGAPEATFEDVIRAAQAAHAHEFIVDKEHGYDTIVGEGGAALSGGEKQRIAIARAILQDPPILILDEATSSVDSETEKAIQEAIGNLVRDRTTLAIAHRLATLRNAHRLLVIDDGRIVESGTHDELLKQRGTYAKLVAIQSQLSALRSEVWKG